VRLEPTTITRLMVATPGTTATPAALRFTAHHGLQTTAVQTAS